MTCYQHKWTAWSQRFQVADYFAQERRCTCCGIIEMREIKIK